jgi:SlyX protein
LYLLRFAVADGDTRGKQGWQIMDRYEALEQRMAHLIRAVDDLSDIVARQANEIDRLTRISAMLAEREQGRSDGEAPSANVRPPHW